MVENLNKLCFEKLLVVATIALSCVSMWGCSDTTFEWEEKRSGAQVVGFVNDSLVMVEDLRCWHEYTDRWNGEYLEDEGCKDARLCVYNYRVQEDGPRWCDSLISGNSGDTHGVWGGQLADSVIWDWDGLNTNTIVLWKINEKIHKIPLIKKKESCSVVFRGNSVKEWFNGTFIMRDGKSLKLGGDSCQYAVLDTLSKTLTYKRMDKNLEWINECDDVRTWGKDVYCIEKNSDETAFYLKVNEKKEDSVFAANVINISSLWSSFEFEFAGEMIYFGHNINTIDYKSRKIKIYPNVKATSAFNYVDENDNNVNYERVAR